MMKLKLFAWTGLCAIACSALDDQSVSNSFLRMTFSNERICIQDNAGNPLLTTGFLDFSWSSPKATPVKAEKINDHTLHVTYRIDDDPTGSVTVNGTFLLKEKNVHCRYDLTARNVKVGGIMQKLTPQKGLISRPVYKAGIWTRVPQGTSFERRGEILRQYQGKEQSLWYLVNGNHLWSSYDNVHLRVKNIGNGVYRGETQLTLYPSNMQAYEVAAANRGEPVALKISTERDFNLFQGDETPSFSLDFANVSGGPITDAALRVTVRNYDGKIVLQQQRKIEMPSSKKYAETFSLPKVEREIYFVDASITVAAKEYFTRTNVAILPAYEYQNPRSEIGIAAFFQVPSRTAVFRLLKRIGVRNLRNGNNKEAARYGMSAYFHNNVNGHLMYDAQRDGKALSRMLDQYREQQNIGWEFGNEWNFQKNPEQSRKSVAVYVSWLKAIRQEAAKRGQKINLISQGLAGADQEYLRELAKAGGWELIDGVACHPGRGNWTPDCLGSGWFFLGSIRRMQQVMKELGGDKPLYLTEVYAKTVPNNWWADSYRLAAENTLLSLALGIAEKVTAIQFYQLHDAVWADSNGVNERNAEYFYGMLMRDNSPKPNLLAFAAASEALDDAEFLRYVEISNSRIHGMEFMTPRGKMAILYDRSEGYKLSEPSKEFVWPEPWVEHWRIFQSHTFLSSQKQLYIRDSIGREKVVEVTDGKVKLTLSGSPFIVYGLDIP